MHSAHAARMRQKGPRWLLVLCMALGSYAAHAGTHDTQARTDSKPAETMHRREHAKQPNPQFGMASVYARMLHGQVTASGEKHDGNDFTAAHRTLPLGTQVRVTNLSNDRSVVVRINDRGPQVMSRIIDLSPGAASEIGLRSRGKGVTRVRLDVIDGPTLQAQTSASAEVAGMQQKRVDRASKERALPEHAGKEARP